MADALRSLVRAAAATAGQTGRASATVLADAVEGPARALAGRVTAAAVAQPRPVGDRASLAEALARRPRAPALGGATVTALATRVARRVGPLRFLARRTPMWLAVAAAPALHASFSRGAEELGLLASHLVLRARHAGVVPDPDRVRRVAVQLAGGAPVDARTEPRHARVALAWTGRAARSVLPLSPGVSTPDPDGLAAAAAAVLPSSLAAPPRELPG